MEPGRLALGRPGTADGWWRGFALLSYVLVAVAIIGVRPLITPGVVAGEGVDLPGTLWMHWWVRESVESLAAPLRTDLFFYPDGKSVFADTGGNFLDAMLGIPLQWMFGNPDYLDVLQILVLCGNALAMELLAGDLCEGRRAPALAAALAFELSPHTLEQVTQGRPTQALLCFAVLAARHALRLRDGTWRDAALFGVYTALQGMTYWFGVYFLALGLLPVVAWQLAGAPRRVAPRLAASVAIVILAATPFLAVFAGELAAGRVGRVQLDAEGGPLGSATRWQFFADQAWNLPWLAILGLGLASARRPWPLLLGALLTGLVAVGPHVDVGGLVVDNPLFHALSTHVPFVDRLGFPERVTAVTFLLLVLAATVTLARQRAWVSLVLPALLLADGAARDTLPAPVARMPPPRGHELIAREGGAVIWLPFGSSERAMLAQIVHGQPLFGGMGDREADMRPAGFERRLANSFVIMLGGTLNDAHVPIAYTLADRELILRDFRWVYLDLSVSTEALNALGYAPVAKYWRLVEELGPPAAREPTFVLWDLHAALPSDSPGRSPAAVPASDELARIGFGAGTDTRTPPTSTASRP